MMIEAGDKGDYKLRQTSKAWDVQGNTKFEMNIIIIIRTMREMDREMKE